MTNTHIRLIDRMPQIFRGLAIVWLKVVGGGLAFTHLIAFVAPVAVVTGVAMFAIPILALVIWGYALDETMQGPRRDDGPW